MSLAIYAAPFNNDLNTEFSTEYSSIPSSNQNSNRKKNTNNRTQKRYSKEDYNSEKVNSVLDAIHNTNSQMMDHSSLGDFKPLEPPVSVGVENTKINNPDTVNDNDDIDLHALKSNYMNEQAANQYYKQFIPNYGGDSSQNKNHNPQSNPAHTNGTHTNGTHTNGGMYNGMTQNDTLMTKLNYMIHLLEERQDERTNNVTEEVILYSFLGVFMIFIVDSFVKVGKYVR
jgi:hypothetical protein